MKLSDAYVGMQVVALGPGCSCGVNYSRGQRATVKSLPLDWPGNWVLLLDDGREVVGASRWNWEPGDPPSLPVPANPEDEFVVAHAACPWCGAEWRVMDRAAPGAVCWACNSFKRDGKTEQSISCKANVSEAVNTLASLRAVLLRPKSLAGMPRDLRLEVLAILTPDSGEEEADSDE
jgi:hypothetical protein